MLTNVRVYSLLGFRRKRRDGGRTGPTAESFSGGLGLAAFVGWILGDPFTLLLTAIQIRIQDHAQER